MIYKSTLGGPPHLWAPKCLLLLYSISFVSVCLTESLSVCPSYTLTQNLRRLRNQASPVRQVSRWITMSYIWSVTHSASICCVAWWVRLMVYWMEDQELVVMVKVPLTFWFEKIKDMIVTDFEQCTEQSVCVCVYIHHSCFYAHSYLCITWHFDLELQCLSFCTWICVYFSLWFCMMMCAYLSFSLMMCVSICWCPCF